MNDRDFERLERRLTNFLLFCMIAGAMTIAFLCAARW